ncbi:MAG: hypothetical protein HOQ05_13920 [Corynebacteriales bacterium]|nr:hypothetical protein [Mycobacteriales bacterium]
MSFLSSKTVRIAIVGAAFMLASFAGVGVAQAAEASTGKTPTIWCSPQRYGTCYNF